MAKFTAVITDLGYASYEPERAELAAVDCEMTLAQCTTPEEIADELELELAPVHAALAYYHSHRDKIEADLLANTEEAVLREWETESRG